MVGGHDQNNVESLPTEKCTMSKTDIICTAQQPELIAYQQFVQLFNVADDFCKHLV